MINIKKTILKELEAYNEQKEELEINTMFVDRKTGRKKVYVGYNALISKYDIMDTIKSSFNYIENELNKRSFEQYDLELSIDDTVQIVGKDKVINHTNVISEIAECIRDKRILDSDVKMQNIDFITMQLYSKSKNESIYLFQKYIHPTSKYKRTFKFLLNGKEAKPITEDIITLNPVVDAFLYNDKFYILNRKNFNTIFNFKDIFNKVINDNMEKIKKSDLFESVDKFLEDCMDDGRHLPRLTKVILSNGFDDVKLNKHKLLDLKVKHNLAFKLTKDNKIKYTDKNEISDILKLLLNHFVKSALTDKDMVAKAIEKYEI